MPMISRQWAGLMSNWGLTCEAGLELGEWDSRGTEVGLDRCVSDVFLYFSLSQWLFSLGTYILRHATIIA